MTKTEACKLLDISISATRPQAELAYRQKQKKLQLQLIPGMPPETRRKAQSELVRLDSAWQTLKTLPVQEPIKIKPPRATPRPKRSVPNLERKPNTLGEAWEQLSSTCPFPGPVLAVLLIVVFLLIILGSLVNPTKVRKKLSKGK